MFCGWLEIGITPAAYREANYKKRRCSRHRIINGNALMPRKADKWYPSSTMSV